MRPDPERVFEALNQRGVDFVAFVWDNERGVLVLFVRGELGFGEIAGLEAELGCPIEVRRA